MEEYDITLNGKEYRCQIETSIERDQTTPSHWIDTTFFSAESEEGIVENVKLLQTLQEKCEIKYSEEYFEGGD